MGLKFRFNIAFYAIIAILVAVLLQIFLKDSGGEAINEYTVYKNSTTNKLVNYKIKEDVKAAVTSTEGLTTAGSSDSYTVADGGKINEVWTIIKKYSEQYQVDPLFLATICSLESDFGMYAPAYVADGYDGLMQLGVQPITQLKEWGTWEPNSMTMDRMDDDNNIHIATVYLKGGYEHFVKGSKYKDDIGAWAAGYNSWWDSTIRKDPPYLANSGSKDPLENKRYYEMAKLVYNAYKTGSRKIGESKDWARKQVGY